MSNPNAVINHSNNDTTNSRRSPPRVNNNISLQQTQHFQTNACFVAPPQVTFAAPVVIIPDTNNTKEDK
jgi:hypothetical protein